MVVAIGACLTVSCTTDAPDLPAQDVSSQFSNNSSNSNSSGNNSGDGEVSKVQALVKQHVNVKASYANYTWTFEVESTLHQALPNETIVYGIGHGDVQGTTNISVEEDAYGYSSYMFNGRKCMEFTNPIFFYWAFGQGSLEGDSNYIFWTGLDKIRSLNALEKRMSDPDFPITTEEKLAHKEIKQWLDQYETTTNRNYHPSIKVYVNNRYYTAGTYSR